MKTKTEPIFRYEVGQEVEAYNDSGTNFVGRVRDRWISKVDGSNMYNIAFKNVATVGGLRVPICSYAEQDLYRIREEALEENFPDAVEKRYKKIRELTSKMTVTAQRVRTIEQLDTLLETL